MQLLRSLFFLEATHQFRLSSVHIAGVDNELADDLSRNRLRDFKGKTVGMDVHSSPIPDCLLQWATSTAPRLVIPELDSSVHFFCSKGIAESTQRTYRSALNKFSRFCTQFNILSPFPVSEPLLCYFASFLAASENISPKSLKVYLSGIRHMQVVLGLPEPREFSSLPRLRLGYRGHTLSVLLKQRGFVCLSHLAYWIG